MFHKKITKLDVLNSSHFDNHKFNLPKSCASYCSLSVARDDGQIQIMIGTGAGTNLKVGGIGPERKLGGGTDPAIFLVVPLLFLALKAQLVVLVSTVWSVSC